MILDPRPMSPDAAWTLRWRDLAGSPYAEGFRDEQFYDRGERSHVAVTWAERGATFSGTLKAAGLKPNFAYQMKLTGRVPATGERRPPAPDRDPEGGASWQLGHNGRWLCQTCGSNVSDAELRAHVKRGHLVYGYLLFDFFITDADGNATRPFALDSSYHVLWRTDQREPPRADSPVVWHPITRGPWGYLLDAPAAGETVGVFAEGEPDRPGPGRARLPAGSYPVRFNITEESFHANLSYDEEHGGFWAQVLESDIAFVVEPSGRRR